MQKEYKFLSFSYNINETLASKDITLALNRFYTEELIKIDLKTKFVLLFKIKTRSGHLINISSLQTLDKTKIDDLNEILKEF